MTFISELSSLLLLGSVVWLHLVLSPYTKVEESFNIQATHDILAYGIPYSNVSSHFASNYDHEDFPGPVPRTFVGSVVLAGLTRLLRVMVSAHDPVQQQVLVRASLGLLNTAALLSFRRAFQRAFGEAAANWFVILQASQFHVMYYASRTLPNMYAFALTTLAMRSYVLSLFLTSAASEYQWQTLALITYAGVVFRSELAVLVLTFSAFIYYRNRRSLAKTIMPAGMIGLVSGLMTTVPVDSYFWRKFPLWPEWSSFYYNTILGNSSNWGTSPWHFYFSNALPRLLLSPMSYAVLIPIAVLSPATRQRSLAIVIPSLAFVALYSFLPHKEWRFILYVIPGLTSVAALGASWIWTRRNKSFFYRILSAILVASVLLSFVASFGILAISRINYPGGRAMVRLRLMTEKEPGTVHVYMDNLACQTGASRFLEARSQRAMDGSAKWRFDKTEDVRKLRNESFWQQFDYMIAERQPEMQAGQLVSISEVWGFSGVRVVKPGENLMDDNVLDALDFTGDRLEDVVVLWKAFETFMRKRVTRGWWVTVRVRPKLRIWKYDRTAVSDDVAAYGEVVQEPIE